MIVIGKNSIHYEYLDGGLKVMVNVLSSKISIIRYLDDVVFIEEGVTVGDLFNLLAEYEEDIDFAFDGSLGGYPFGLYLDEVDEKQIPDDNLIFAEFSHESMLADDLAITPRFGAVGYDPESKNLIPYSVELCPIGSYKHLEIKLNTDLNIVKKEGTDEEEVILSTSKMFSLYDLIHAMLYEISYHGTPAMRKVIMDELTAAIMAGEQDIVLSGSEVIIKKDEEIDRLQAELEESVKKEDYEKSAKLRDKIAQLTLDKSDKDRNKQK